ncbi:MAG: hypothetical protein ABIB61_01840 [Candidatus Shapirobacteria bacterium]
MLTKPDLDEIEKIVEKKFEEKFAYLPTKDEFYESIDQVMGTLNKIQEEMAGMSSTYENHEERITTLEDLHPELTPE